MSETPYSDPVQYPSSATLQALLRASFATRDELYAAADALKDAHLRSVCRQLGQVMAANAAELEEMLVAAGEDLDAPPAGLHQLWVAALRVIAEVHGEQAVVDRAASSEAGLERLYAEALGETRSAQLQRHQKSLELGHRLLDRLAHE